MLRSKHDEIDNHIGQDCFTHNLTFNKTYLNFIAILVKLVSLMIHDILRIYQIVLQVDISKINYPLKLILL